MQRSYFVRMLGASIGTLTAATIGCASSSIGADVSRVRELTKVSQLPGVTDDDIEPGTGHDVARLLQQPLDAETAVRIALLNNRELRAVLRELGIARGQMRQAGVVPNPVVEAELPPETDTMLELRVEYDLTRALLAPVRSGAAQHRVEAARYHAAAAVIELGYRVRVAFYAVQSAEQRLAVAQQSLEALAASRDAARALREAGNVRELDAASHEAAYERSRIDVALMELEAANAREGLQRLFGVRGANTRWRVRDSLSAVPEKPSVAEDAETVALQASLELAETSERLQALSRQAGVSRTEGWLPDVSVNVSGRRSHPETGATQEDEWHYGAGVKVGVPIFDRGQGTTAALSAEFDALLERYYGMATDIRSAVREARNRVLSAHARARQYQHTIIPAQARVTAQTLLQYNAMQLGVFEVIAARREDFAVQLAYLETLRAYYCAVAELDAALTGARAMSVTREVAPSMGMPTGAAGGH